MSLADDIDADLGAVFFAEDGIGVVEAVYRLADGTVVREMRGIFDNGYSEDFGAHAAIAGRLPTFTTAETHFPCTFTPVVGATLTIQVDPQTSTAYTIRNVQPDGTGEVVLNLEGP